MMKRKRSPLEKEVDREILSQGKAVLREWSQTEALHVPAKKRESKLISIRLPMDMMEQLKKIASKKGEIGYQQLIKTYIAEGLLKEELKILARTWEYSKPAEENVSSGSSSLFKEFISPGYSL